MKMQRIPHDDKKQKHADGCEGLGCEWGLISIAVKICCGRRPPIQVG